MATVALLATLTITQNTATQLTATRTPVNGFMVQAHPDNTAVIWFGDSTVSASNKKGVRMEIPVSGATLPFVTVSAGDSDALNLADYYMDSASASQKVNVFYTVI